MPKFVGRVKNGCPMGQSTIPVLSNRFLVGPCPHTGGTAESAESAEDRQAGKKKAMIPVLFLKSNRGFILLGNASAVSALSAVLNLRRGINAITLFLLCQS